MLDTRVIATRLKKLDDYLRGLRPFQQIPLDEYLRDENMQMIVERRLQLSIQVCIDIANYLISYLGLRAPDEQENVFAVLGEEGIITPALAQRLEINSSLVHEHLRQRLADFDQFSRELIQQFPSLQAGEAPLSGCPM